MRDSIILKGEMDGSGVVNRRGRVACFVCHTESLFARCTSCILIRIRIRVRSRLFSHLRHKGTNSTNISLRSGYY
jgi:hypothetical protein